MMSQEEFSNKLGISLRAYQNYERGERSISKELLCALLSTFEVELSWLLTGKGEMYISPSEKTLSLENIWEWLKFYWEQADEKERAWLEVQMKKCFPEFKEWLEQQKS